MKTVKHLCKAVKKVGKLRKTLGRIDFDRIYGDKDKAARARADFEKKLVCLSDIQHDLLMFMKEV